MSSARNQREAGGKDRCENLKSIIIEFRHIQALNKLCVLFYVILFMAMVTMCTAFFNVKTTRCFALSLFVGFISSKGTMIIF
jgi:hypothetical protein